VITTRTRRSSRYAISLGVSQRQLGGQPIRFQPADRALLAAVLRPLPRPTPAERAGGELFQLAERVAGAAGDDGGW
jgi:hypothetical protein